MNICVARETRRSTQDLLITFLTIPVHNWQSVCMLTHVYAFLISRVCTAREWYYFKSMEKNNAVHYYNLN